MARVLYFDCFSGASGDMILGALLDAGLPLAELERALRSLPLDDVAVRVTRVDRSGIGATKFTVDTGEGETGHASDERRAHHHDHTGHHHHHAHHHDDSGGHDHSHHDDGGHRHHHHRGLGEICRLVDESELTAPVKERAKRLFRRLAEVEADIHQMPVEDVHLHEVGAVDSIVDIVGGVFAMEWFGADRIVSSPLNVGSGTVTCAHGVMPVPAPATARLIEGVPVYARGPAVELLTPTGALLITDYAQSYGPLPEMTVRATGYGAGDRNPSGQPNLLRVLVGETETSAPLQRIVMLESEIDDMNPQIFGVLMDRLHAAGALDVFYAPIQMKKNRPGTLVSIVARPEDRARLADIVFAETTTLGLRIVDMERECLEREMVNVETPWGAVRVKVARRAGRILNAAPEFDDCVTLADRHGVSVKRVQALAAKAYLDRGD